MRLTVVGCAGSFPTAESPCSSYLVEADGFRLLIDLGNGALGALQRYVGLYDIDAVLLTHLHPDHFVDLLPYVVARRYSPDGLPARIPVYGPTGTLRRVAVSYDAEPARIQEVFAFRSMAEGTLSIGPFDVRMARMAHPVETYAMRLSFGGRSIAYSADTGPCESLVSLSAGADLLLCEASFLDGEVNPPDLHLTGGQAADHAERAGIGRLVLTHLVAWGNPARTLDEAQARYRGPVELAAPASTYDV